MMSEPEKSILRRSKDRSHRNLRIYLRRHGRKIRIRPKLGTAAFAQAYAAALRAFENDTPSGRPTVKSPPAGTLDGVTGVGRAIDRSL